METFEKLMEEYQSVATDLAQAYKNFQTLREMGVNEPKLEELRQILEIKEMYLKGLLDRINRTCVDQTCSRSEASR